jgi:hypothetical protein
MSNFQKLDWKIKTCLHVLMIIVTLMAYGYQLMSANLISHIPYIETLLNPELYKSDFFVQEALQFSPRFYYQQIIASTIKLGLSLPLTYFLYYTLAFSSFIWGLYALGIKFGKSKLSAAALAFLGLFVIDGTVGVVDLFRTEPIPPVLAMGITIWGLYYGIYIYLWIYKTSSSHYFFGF